MIPTKPKFKVKLTGPPYGRYYSASEVDAWLSEHFKLFECAEVLHGRINGDFGWFDRKWNPFNEVENTHQRLALKPTPIVEESAEDILRELMESLEEHYGDAYQKAKAYLKSKGMKRE